MSPEQLKRMIARLRNYGLGTIVVGVRRFKEGEGDRFADQIEDMFETYTSPEYDTEKSVIEDVVETFNEVDDDSDMFDDEESEERNEVW